jgi:hypothetical protein
MSDAAMLWFVSHYVDGKEFVLKFNTVEQYFEWLQDWKDKSGFVPEAMSVYRGKCVYDGS